jgi:ssDNA-binding Zn-finger/Zn-ribbon topoisomerase 1
MGEMAEMMLDQMIDEMLFGPDYSSFYYEYRYGEGPCPYCGRDTILRQGPHGMFYGCTAFPKCSGTRYYNGEGRSLFDSMVETTTDDPYAELVGNLIATGGSHNTKGGSMSDSRKSPVKLTMKQIVEAHAYLKENQGSFRGMTQPVAAKVASESLGFPITISTIQQMQKQFGLKICVTGSSKVSAADRIASIEQRLDKLESHVFPDEDGEWGPR